MPRGGYHPDAYPWSQVKPDNRAERVRERLGERDALALAALVKHHQERQGKRSPRTLSAYRTGVKIYLEWAFDHLADKILIPGPDVGADYLRFLERRGLAPASVNARRAAVVALYAALRWTGASSADPMRDTPAVRDPTPRHEKREPYREDEFKALLAAAQLPEERAFLLLGGVAGLRLSELLALTWADIDASAGVVIIQSGKGGKKRRVYAPAQLFSLLAEVRTLAVTRKRRATFVLPWSKADTVRLHLQTLCISAEVRYQGREVHGLRHTAGTRLYKKTRNLDTVARHLGHSQIETSRIYAEWDSDDVRNALEGLEF